MKLISFLIIYFILSNSILSNDNITIPNIFNAGDQASAEKFNQNFDEIQNKFNSFLKNDYFYMKGEPLRINFCRSGKTPYSNSDGYSNQNCSTELTTYNIPENYGFYFIDVETKSGGHYDRTLLSVNDKNYSILSLDGKNYKKNIILKGKIGIPHIYHKRSGSATPYTNYYELVIYGYLISLDNVNYLTFHSNDIHSLKGCTPKIHFSDLESNIQNNLVKITYFWPSQPDGDLTWGGVGNISDDTNGLLVNSKDFPEWTRFIGYGAGFESVYAKKGDHVYGQCESQGTTSLLRGGLFFGKIIEN